MITTGLIGHGYWGKIIEQKLRMVSDLKFIQTSKNYDTNEFKNVDWIFIVTPTNTHFNIAKDCILAGVNVFLEKPATETAAEYLELIELSKQHNTKLYISNVFLFRKEVSRKCTEYGTINLTWYKNDRFNGSLADNLLYHDLYILITVCGLKIISEIYIYKNVKDRLFFSMKYGVAKVFADYRRDVGLEAKHLWDSIVFMPKIKYDPLKTMIKKCLSDDIYFKDNFELNFKTLTLMDTIKQKLK